MSLSNPTFQVRINAVDYSSKVVSFYCTDQDLTLGLGECEIILADSAGSASSLAAATFPAFGTEKGLWYPVSISVNGVLVFQGLVELVEPDTSASGDTLKFQGYNYGVDLANIFITKDYSNTTWIGGGVGLSGGFLHDVLTNAGKTFPHVSLVVVGVALAYPSTVTTPGTLKQKFALDIFREVCSVTGWAGQVDTAGNINFFDPNDGNHNLLTTTVTSIYNSSANQLKDGRLSRKLHDVKNYLEFSGAGSGFDPFNLGGIAAAGILGTPTYNGVTMQWTARSAGTVTIASDYVTFPNNTSSSIRFTPSAPQNGPVQSVFTFGTGNPAHGGASEVYQIKNDVDNSTFMLNQIFNNKNNLHFWANVSASGTTPNVAIFPSFVDNNGNIAAGLVTPGTVTTILGDALWHEITIPTPFGTPSVYQTPASYNTSNNVQLILQVNRPSTLQPIVEWHFADVYFTCNPFYSTPLKSALTNLSYGERDQAVSTGANQFGNQFDLQHYGDSVYSKYQYPQLRSPLTVLVDPATTLYKSGYRTNLNIPRWGIAANTPLWRILQVRHEYSAKQGFVTKLDLTPSTAA